MATKRKTEYEKALRRLVGAVTDEMTAQDDNLAARAQARADRWLTRVLETHWENHPEEISECD
ncbi:MAG TPA: hypothetical protein VNT52_17595, partial [Acidimicrobiales bacterium]|nr:hypothetical protein [Acidimicrobiales bacterium]